MLIGICKFQKFIFIFSFAIKTKNFLLVFEALLHLQSYWIAFFKQNNKKKNLLNELAVKG